MNELVPACTNCRGRKSVKLRRQVAASGINQVGWWCVECERFADPSRAFVPHATVMEWIKNGRLKCDSIDGLPLVADYSTKRLCEVCKARGAELHHWLPQAFAEVMNGSHGQWPVSYLCKTCHNVWHELVTPYLPGRGGTPLTEYTINKYFGRYQDKTNEHKNSPIK